MSLAVTHFAVGMALTLLLVRVVAPFARCRTTVGVLGGFWALLPDLHYVLPGRWPPLRELKDTVLGDLFWFHATLDGLEKGQGSRRTAAAALGILLLVVVTVEWTDRRDDGTDDRLRSARR